MNRCRLVHAMFWRWEIEYAWEQEPWSFIWRLTLLPLVALLVAFQFNEAEPLSYVLSFCILRLPQKHYTRNVHDWIDFYRSNRQAEKTNHKRPAGVHESLKTSKLEINTRIPEPTEGCIMDNRNVAGCTDLNLLVDSFVSPHSLSHVASQPPDYTMAISGNRYVKLHYCCL